MTSFSPLDTWRMTTNQYDIFRLGFHNTYPYNYWHQYSEMPYYSYQYYPHSLRPTITQPDSQPEETVFITDKTGKSWDITHAVENYDMMKDDFKIGLGPNAITPINLPEMIMPGEPGYPEDTSSTSVIGVSINGETRAYPLLALASMEDRILHEVINDIVGGVHVAILY